jgi:hypothetical protein
LFSFAKFILFILIFSKITFVYYNFWVSVILIGGSLIFASKALNYFSVVTIWCLVAINIILLFIPDLKFFEYFNPSSVKWHQISLSEFKKSPDKDPIHGAIIVTDFRWKINSTYNYPAIVVFSGMRPDESWVRPELKNNKTILEHEQFHFDIVEYNKRLLIDNVNKCWKDNYATKEAIGTYYEYHKKEMQSLYDSSYFYKDSLTLEVLKKAVSSKLY